MTLGGVSRPWLGRVDKTSGALDTGWTPTLTGGGTQAFDAYADGSTVYVAGNFQTVNGQARPLGCSFTGGSLDSFKLQNSLGHVVRDRLANAGAGTLSSVVRVGSFILFAGDVSLYINQSSVGLGYLGRGFILADPTTGVVSQAGRDVNNANAFTSSQDLRVSGAFLGALANTGGAISYPELPLATGGTDPTSAAPRIDSSGNISASFAPTIAAAGQLRATASDGSAVFIGGIIGSFGGDTARKSLARHSSSGALDTGFTFTSRGNATFIAGTPDIASVGYTSGVIVVVGTFGGATHTYDGVRAENILVLNSTTGARV
jgi:hypothetical protein